jgi:hypothetical protein
MNKFLTYCVDAYIENATDKITDYLSVQGYWDMVNGEQETSNIGKKRAERLLKIRDQLEAMTWDTSWISDDAYSDEVTEAILYLLAHVDSDDVRPDVLSDVEETLFKPRDKK